MLFNSEKKNIYDSVNFSLLIVCGHRFRPNIKWHVHVTSIQIETFFFFFFILGLIQLWNINHALFFWISLEHCKKEIIRNLSKFHFSAFSLSALLRCPKKNKNKLCLRTRIYICPGRRMNELRSKNKIIVTTILRS